MTNAPERDKSWGSLEDPHFLLLMANNSLCVNATAEGLQGRTEIMERWQQQRAHVKESRRVEEIPQRWKEPKGEDRTKMNKEAKIMRCTSLNGSVWSSERKYTRRYKGKYDIFLGIEHRLRKEAMVEQFNKEAQEGLRFASDAARITGFFAAVDSNLGAVVGEKEGALTSIPGNEGRIAQAWVNVRGGVIFFAAYFWHTEGWTPRNEAILEAVLGARATTHPWLVACDADIRPVDFEKSLWFFKKTRCM